MNNSTDPNQTSLGDIPVPGFSPLLIFFVTIQQLMFIMACLGNGLVTIVFAKYLKFKSMTNRFVVSLAIADFCAGLSAFTQVFYFLYPTLSKNMVTCFLRYQVIAFMTLASLLTVTFTTFDRFVAICFPHSYKKIMTNTMTNCLIAVAWIYSFIISHFPYTGLNEWTPTSLCIYRHIFVKSTYTLAAVTLWLFSIITFVMYIFIWRRAWRYFKRVKPVNEINQNQTPENRNKRTEKDVRMAKVMGVVTIAFTVCWTPFSVCQFRYGLPGDYDAEECDWFVFIGLFNSILNPFIYAAQRRDFYTACRKMYICLVGGANQNVLEMPSYTTDVRPDR